MRSSLLASLLTVCTFALIHGGTPCGAAPKVLYLGDSMSMGAFGKKLDEEMRGAGFDVYTFVAGGATPYYWLSRYSPISSSIGYWQKTPNNEIKKRYIKAVPKVEKLVGEHEPDVVVVQTGTNLYATLRSKRRTKEANVREIERLLEDMAKAVTGDGRRIYWITPPDAHPNRYPEALQDEMAAIMKRVVGKYGAVFDSRLHTEFTDPYPKTDGIHYGPTEARQWAQVVANDFKGFMMRQDGIDRTVLLADNGSDENIVDATPSPRKADAVEVNDVRKLIASAIRVDPAPEPQPEKTVAIVGVPEEEKVDPASIPEQWGPVDVNLRLIRKSKVEHLNNVTYHHCLALYEYEILRIDSGEYPYRTIRIAETAVFNRKRTKALDFKIGQIRSLKVDPLSFYPNLEHWQLNDDLPLRPELPVYIPSMRRR